MKIGFARSNDVAKAPRKSSSDSGFRVRNEMRKKSDNDVFRGSHSKSLLNVPAIFVDNVSDSNLSIFDNSSISEEDPSVADVNSRDVDTVSMIVRNVEAIDKMEMRRHSDEPRLVEEPRLVDIELPITVEHVDTETKVGSPKKHDFIHDLKDSIQEKFHHISDNIKHKRESPQREPGKAKERLHDFKENVSGKFHQIAEKMHNFHLPHLPHHHEPDDGLIAQAMQTILMEKFNIAEASTSVSDSSEAALKRKSSSSSLQSIKQKFNLFQRPRRPVEMPSETGSLKSISEVHSAGQSEKTSESEDHEVKLPRTEDTSSLLELKIHDDEATTSNESLITVLSLERKAISKEDLRLSVENFDSYLSTHPTFSKASKFSDTNKKPLHESLLSLHRNEMLSTSPGGKMHARTESIGNKFSASPQKTVTGSLGKDQTLSNIHRRSSDSDLSITPKGEKTLCWINFPR